MSERAHFYDFLKLDQELLVIVLVFVTEWVVAQIKPLQTKSVPGKVSAHACQRLRVKAGRGQLELLKGLIVGAQEFEQGARNPQV